MCNNDNVRLRQDKGQTMNNWTRELEYQGFTRNEGCADDIIESWEKEFDDGFIGFVDVYGDGTFAVSALHDGEIAFCDDDQHISVIAAITVLEDEIYKLQQAWE